MNASQEMLLRKYVEAVLTAPPHLHFLVRAQHDRLLHAGEKLWDHLSNPSLGGTMTVKIPRNTDRPARTATLALRWAPIQIKPPRVGCKNSWGLTEVGP